jgi:hypothetical protein
MQLARYFELMLGMMFFTGVLSTLLHAKMRYSEIERQRLKEEI